MSRVTAGAICLAVISALLLTGCTSGPTSQRGSGQSSHVASQAISRRDVRLALVPNVTNLDVRVATRDLAAVGLRARRWWEHSQIPGHERPWGSVVTQTPKPGVRVRSGSAVVLMLAR